MVGFHPKKEKNRRNSTEEKYLQWHKNRVVGTTHEYSETRNYPTVPNSGTCGAREAAAALPAPDAAQHE